MGWGFERELKGTGGPHLLLHQVVAGRALLAAGATLCREEVVLAAVALVAHEARTAQAGAVLQTLS